jgi:hypothetical protein
MLMIGRGPAEDRSFSPRERFQAPRILASGVTISHVEDERHERRDEVQGPPSPDGEPAADHSDRRTASLHRARRRVEDLDVDEAGISNSRVPRLSCARWL